MARGRRLYWLKPALSKPGIPDVHEAMNAMARFVKKQIVES
jgi:hypothetical protein